MYVIPHLSSFNVLNSEEFSKEAQRKHLAAAWLPRHCHSNPSALHCGNNRARRFPPMRSPASLLRTCCDGALHSQGGLAPLPGLAAIGPPLATAPLPGFAAVLAGGPLSAAGRSKVYCALLLGSVAVGRPSQRPTGHTLCHMSRITAHRRLIA